MGLYYDEMEVGQEWISPGRTVTDYDILAFATLTSDMNPIHVDHEYCKTTPFGAPIAHGFLIASLAAGFGARMGIAEGTIVANLGISWRFQNPVKAGDTIHLVMSVKEKRPSKSRPGEGIIIRTYDVKNQRGETCAIGEVAATFKCKPTD
ncbi:MaoC/PaaZ C-terminal domain-containing protein [Novosphingobium sp. KN65.2]|uniref:MaoC family dehydratase n=1 Tax=Novosphingobium sp. KN65.2 TaxID=1478134 RepID=UPI0005E55BC4|nr:MaoC/PaaZ C-terminal domain-containing protein [Novosphingobium sp. KN65.2]CDO35883.1 MaoC domain protein dehydratase [Novosphingobium sp. KN65.2]